MATNAIIATLIAGGQVSATTVNWDGDSIGPILAEHYSTHYLTKRLISHGAISSLGVRIDALTCHTFDEREEGTTTFYHRDRGEDLSIYKFDDFDTFEEWLHEGPCIEYVYYFDGQKWGAVTMEQGAMGSKFSKFTAL